MSELRSTIAGIIAWGTFGALNGAVVSAVILSDDAPKGPHLYGLAIGAVSGAVLGIVGWYLRATLKKK